MFLGDAGSVQLFAVDINNRAQFLEGFGEGKQGNGCFRELSKRELDRTKALCFQILLPADKRSTVGLANATVRK